MQRGYHPGLRDKVPQPISIHNNPSGLLGATTRLRTIPMTTTRRTTRAKRSIAQASSLGHGEPLHTPESRTVAPPRTSPRSTARDSQSTPLRSGKRRVQLATPTTLHNPESRPVNPQQTPRSSRKRGCPPTDPSPTAQNSQSSGLRDGKRRALSATPATSHTPLSTPPDTTKLFNVPIRHTSPCPPNSTMGNQPSPTTAIRRSPQGRSSSVSLASGTVQRKLWSIRSLVIAARGITAEPEVAPGTPNASESLPPELQEEDAIATPNAADYRTLEHEDEFSRSSSDAEYRPSPPSNTRMRNGPLSQRSPASRSVANSETSPLKKRVYTYKSRRRGKGVDSVLLQRHRAHADAFQNMEVDKLKCCIHRRCFYKVDARYVKAQVQHVSLLNRAGRRAYLEGLLEDNSGMFFFDGKAVCYKFLEKTLQFSRDFQGSVKGTPFSKRRSSLTSTVRNSEANQRDAVICFLERVSESTADHMPDRNEQHLPYFQKAQVFDIFLSEFSRLHSRAPPTRSYFYETWQKHVPNIKVRRVHRFTVCSECDLIRDLLSKAGTDESATRLLRERKTIHNDMVAAERREYQKKCDKAGLYPAKYCSLILDGADQSAFGLPHFLFNTKHTKGHSIKVKLIGVLEHGPVKHLSLFTMTDEYETGANHVLEALHRTLMVKAEKGPLPDTLFVQVDNCTRENKNRYFFGYMESLVAWGVFQEVFVSFLPIGHTHSDIDQAFSCTARRLRHHEAITLEDLITELGKAYNPPPHVADLRQIINFSGLCDQERCLEKPQRFSHFRYFKFHRVEGIPEYRGNSFNTACSARVGCSDDWGSLKVGQCTGGFLKFAPDLAKTPPTEATCPNDLDKINTRLVSEETRVNDRRKLAQLRLLRDRVYESRQERFHWNLRDVFEMTGKYRTVTDAVDGLQDEIEHDEVEIEMEEQPLQDLEYECNDFVVVRGSSCSIETVPFWVGRVISIHKDDEGVTTDLTIHWWEVYNGKCAWTGKYAPSRLHDNRKPWTEFISVATVVSRFSELKKSKEISAAAARQIRQALGVA